MDLEGQGQLSNLGGQGTASGQLGLGSGQLGLASETRGAAEERIALQAAIDQSALEAAYDQGDHESNENSDEEDRFSQAASLACTVDNSVALVVIMPEKVPICFLCSFRADSPNPLVQVVLDAEVSYRPWMSYNKVYKGKVVIGKMPTVCVCRICGNVYKIAGFNAQYGRISEYKKLLGKRDGAQKHKLFLEAVKEWLRQHLENPSRVKLQNKKNLMEVQKQLTTARTHKARFQRPEMEFVLVDDWDEKGDGKYVPSKVVDEFAQVGFRK